MVGNVTPRTRNSDSVWGYTQRASYKGALCTAVAAAAAPILTSLLYEGGGCRMGLNIHLYLFRNLKATLWILNVGSVNLLSTVWLQKFRAWVVMGESASRLPRKLFHLFEYLFTSLPGKLYQVLLVVNIFGVIMIIKEWVNVNADVARPRGMPSMNE